MAKAAQKLDYAAFLARFFPTGAGTTSRPSPRTWPTATRGVLSGPSAAARAVVEDDSGRQSEQPAEHGSGEDDPDERRAS